MVTSFGYFSETDNRRVLIEALECLRPGGRFLLETRHWDGMPRIFEPTTVRQCGDDYLIEHHSYDAETGIQHTRQTLLSGDQRSQNTYGLRRYGFPELRALCLDVGFQAVRGFDEHGDPLQPDSDRCVLVATA